MEIDDETKHELMEGFTELYHEIELVLMNSAASQSGADELNQLFRAIHTIKGNAAIMQLGALVEFTHVIEDVAESLRSKVYTLSEPVSESILLGLDRLRDLHNRELWGHEFGNLHEEELISMYSALAASQQDQCDRRALEILDFMGVGIISARDKEQCSDKVQADTERQCVERYPQLLEIPDQGTPERAKVDMSYFQELSGLVDRQNAYSRDRNRQVFEWGHKMNQISGDKVNRDQLSAAIYLHDLGMMFIPHSILEKGESLDGSEIAMMREHPALACKFLVRIPGWEEAAVMILEHHEWINGEGYPNGIKGEAIHPGACILAILDAFFSIVNERADRATRKSIVRAISEINANKGTQFDPFWVQCFNEMIRAECKAGVF